MSYRRNDTPRVRNAEETILDLHAKVESDAKVIAALREALGNCISYLESETGMTMKHPVLKIAKAAIEQTIGEH